MTENSKNTKNLRRLVLTSLLLTIVVIGLGAYTRLTHAGLGCPDWPGCYGLIDVPETSSQIAAAEKSFPDRPVEPAKAWNEMIHRYFAGSLGLLIAVITFLSIKLRITNKVTKYPLLLPISILFIVTFQAALGMWTVTLKLMPIIVMAHLLGGFTTMCLLFLLYLRLKSKDDINQGTTLVDTHLKKYIRYAAVGIIILMTQIALGGWTSSNYAAMSCVELPICQGNWLNNLTFEQSFDVIPPPKDTYEFGHLSHNERVTIHISHRIGAIITSAFIAWLTIALLIKVRIHEIKRASIVLLTLLFVQVSLGISNIWFSLPLNIAVAHNVVAVLLMLSLISLTYKLKLNSEEPLYE